MSYTTTTDTPQIWVCSIRDYVNGHNVGEWLDLSDYSSEEEVLEAIQVLLKGWDEELGIDPMDVPREEWTIHDYEGFPERFYSESMSFGPVLKWLRETEDMDDDRKEAYELFLDNYSGSNTNVEKFEEAYQGKWESEEEYAEDLFKSCYKEPEFGWDYVDFAYAATSMFAYDYSYEDGHVFNYNV